jgi:hypothetical protein
MTTENTANNEITKARSRVTTNTPALRNNKHIFTCKIVSSGPFIAHLVVSLVVAGGIQN